jgi:hypothetical protein
MTMPFFRSRQQRTDPRWEVASATQVFVADPTTIASLARAYDLGGTPATLDGALIATRHPTGWFLHAARRHDLPEDQLPAFRELVTVRSYLLLTLGPEAPAWLASRVEGEWGSFSFSIARELSELEAALVD